MEKIGVEAVIDGMAAFRSDAARFNSTIAGMNGSVDTAASGISGSSEIIIGALRRIGEIALESLITAGREIIEFGADSIKVAANFESTLNQFSAVAGSSLSDAGMEISDFSDKFLELGAVTQFSAQQAAEAAVELSKGGRSAVEVYDELDDVLGLAAAGGLELATAAEITAKQLGVWGDTGVTAAQVADLLSQAANASTVDVDELALGLANVGGVAKVAGLSFEEVVQTMAMIAPGFSSAADAGTSLKSFLNNLIPTTADATSAMQDLGLANEHGFSSFFNLKGEFVGMEEAARLLAYATTNLTEEERSLALETIFGSDAMRAAAIIAEQGAEGLGAMGEAMTGAGTAAEQAALRNQGFTFAMDSLKGSIETLQIIIGTAFLPILTELLNEKIIPLTNAFMAWATENMPAIQAALGIFVSQIENNTGPALQSLLDFLSPVIQGASDLADAFIDSMPLIVDAVQSMADSILEQVDILAPTLLTNIGSMLTTLAEFWSTHGETIIGHIQRTFETLSVIVGTTLTVISGIIAVGLNNAQMLFDVASAVMQGDWQTAWNAITSTTQQNNNIILSVITAGMNSILSLVGQDLDSFLAMWIENFTMAGIIVQTSVHKIGVFLSDGLNSAIEAAQAIVAGTWAVGEALVMGIVKGIEDGAIKLANAAVSAVFAAIDAAKEAAGIQSPSTVAAEEIGKPIVQGIVKGMDEERSTLDNYISSMAGDVSTLFDLAGGFSGLGGAAFSMWKDEQLDPMTDYVKDMTKQWEKGRKDLEKSFGKGGGDKFQFLIENVDFLTKQGMNPTDLAVFTQMGISMEQIHEAQRLNQLWDERVAAATELAEQQKIAAEFEKQQRDLQFLQQQMKLIETIQEHGLDPAQILGGLQLGIDANLQDVVAAMSAAMQSIIAQINEDLDIHSPSGVFEWIGKQMMVGLERGIDANAPTQSLSTALRSAIMPASSITNWNLNVSSSQSSQGIIGDFAIMQSLAT